MDKWRYKRIIFILIQSLIYIKLLLHIIVISFQSIIKASCSRKNSTSRNINVELSQYRTYIGKVSALIVGQKGKKYEQKLLISVPAWIIMEKPGNSFCQLNEISAYANSLVVDT